MLKSQLMVFEISQPDSLDLIQLEQVNKSVEYDQSAYARASTRASSFFSGYESYPTGVGYQERVERRLAGVQNCEFLGDRDGTDGDHGKCPVQKVESSEQRVEGEELGDRRALEVFSLFFSFFFLRENNNFVSNHFSSI